MTILPMDPRAIYTVYRKDRSGSHHGGVAVLVHRNLCVAEVITDDSFNSLEILCIDLLLVKDKLRFFVVYRPPHNDAAACSYVNLLVACLEKYSSTEHTNFILGDFNCPRINWVNAYSPGDHISARIFDFMSSRGYSQFINFATRGDNILDLIFSDDDQIICSTDCCPPFGNSDHCLIEFQFVTSSKSDLKPISVQKYNWHKGDHASMEHYLQNIKWDAIIWNNPHALHAWSAFLGLLWDAVDLHVTRFKTTVRTHKKNYPREIRKLIKKKRCLWEKCQTTPGPYTKSQYHKCTKELRRKCRELTKRHEENVILSNNLGMFYKHVNNRISYRSTIGALIGENDTIVTSDSDKACLLRLCWCS